MLDADRLHEAQAGPLGRKAVRGSVFVRLPDIGVGMGEEEADLPLGEPVEAPFIGDDALFGI